MNRAANVYAEALRKATGVKRVWVSLDYTALEIRDSEVEVWQNSAAMRRGLSAGEPEPGEYTLLPIEDTDSYDPNEAREVLNDNVEAAW
jgi:hypothetical protein